MAIRFFRRGRRIDQALINDRDLLLGVEWRLCDNFIDKNETVMQLFASLKSNNKPRRVFGELLSKSSFDMELTFRLLAFKVC